MGKKTLYLVLSRLNPNCNKWKNCPCMCTIDVVTYYYYYYYALFQLIVNKCFHVLGTVFCLMFINLLISLNNSFMQLWLRMLLEVRFYGIQSYLQKDWILILLLISAFFSKAEVTSPWQLICEMKMMLLPNSQITEALMNNTYKALRRMSGTQ